MQTTNGRRFTTMLRVGSHLFCVKKRGPASDPAVDHRRPWTRRGTDAPPPLTRRHQRHRRLPPPHRRRHTTTTTTHGGGRAPLN